MANSIPRPQYVSFDCYGTLINFEITSTTRRLLAGRLPEEEWPAFKKVFRGYRFDEVSGDYKPYEQILQDSFDRVCKRWGIGPTEGAGAEFAEAVRSWGAHEDVPAPLKKMGDNYKLVILSNADDSFLDVSVPRLGADFHSVLTAEQAQALQAPLPGIRVHARPARRDPGGLPARLLAHPLRPDADARHGFPEPGVAGPWL